MLHSLKSCVVYILQGTPEDLLFFYKLLSAGVKLMRVDQQLLVYRYHQLNTTHCVTELSELLPVEQALHHDYIIMMSLSGVA